jgi:RimJ/RimL family protein N-acetyltransferase
MRPDAGRAVVTLRPARGSDRREIYRWLAESDVTASMMGPPLFPDHPPPTWEEFCRDYGPHFFDGTREDVGRSFIIEVAGEPVGQVNYDGMDRARGTAELDIWLRSESVCGRGYGPDALAALTRHLHGTFGVTEFIIRPSLRNPRAIRAYGKAGFTRLGIAGEEQAAIYGPGDYVDTVVMRKSIPARQDGGGQARVGHEGAPDGRRTAAHPTNTGKRKGGTPP